MKLKKCSVNHLRAIITADLFFVFIYLSTMVISFSLYAVATPQTQYMHHMTQFTGETIGPIKVKVIINHHYKGHYFIIFIVTEQGLLVPKLNQNEIEEWGININSVAAFQRQKSVNWQTSLIEAIPQAKIHFDLLKHKLELSIPKTFMQQEEKNASVKWNNGIPAFLLNYNLSGSQKWMAHQGINSSYFLSQNSGFNLGAWRFRDSSTWSYTHTQHGTSHFTTSSINYFLQRNIPILKGDLTLGETYTSADIFDGVLLRGIQLNSDDQMLSATQQGFAPKIQGVANSYAKVTIRQNNEVIYQTYVPPGQFCIDDLFSAANGSNLLVTVTESDGSQHSFVQPFTSIPIMQREGRLKYALAIGHYFPITGDQAIPLNQATFIYGLAHGVTLYGGLQNSDHYTALADGIGMMLGQFGAVSLDNIYERGHWQDEDLHQGQRYRLQYLKTFPEWGSQISLAGDYYSHNGFFSFTEAADHYVTSDINQLDPLKLKHVRVQFTLQQQLPKLSSGTFSLSAYLQNYWYQEGSVRNVALTYGNTWRHIQWSVIYSVTENSLTQLTHDQQMALNISIPLTQLLNSAKMNTSINWDQQGIATAQLGLSGHALQNNKLTYAVQQGYTTKNSSASGTLNVSYKAPYTDISAGYGYDGQSQQLNYGIQGAFIVHKHGITFSKPIANNMLAVALIHVPSGKQVKIINTPGVTIDSSGYAVIPGLKPYRGNEIRIERDVISDSVTNRYAVKTVIPTAGAVAVVTFPIRTGQNLFLHLTYHNKPIPFGAIVELVHQSKHSTYPGIVGSDGVLYMTNMPKTGELVASWKTKGKNEQCHVDFKLPKHLVTTLEYRCS